VTTAFYGITFLFNRPKVLPSRTRINLGRICQGCATKPVTKFRYGIVRPCIMAFWTIFPWTTLLDFKDALSITGLRFKLVRIITGTAFAVTRATVLSLSHSALSDPAFDDSISRSIFRLGGRDSNFGNGGSWFYRRFVLAVLGAPKGQKYTSSSIIPMLSFVELDDLHGASDVDSICPPLLTAHSRLTTSKTNPPPNWNVLDCCRWALVDRQRCKGH
jgi:hypothetical protein